MLKRDKRKSEFQQKIEELKRNVEFYKFQTAIISKRLISVKKIYSQFQLAAECFKKHNGIVEDPLKEECSNAGGRISLDTNDCYLEIQQKYQDIQKNMKIIDELLDGLMMLKEI